MDEEWRGVIGFEEWYEVSSLGRCRAIQRPAKGGARIFHEPYPLILSPLHYKKGYLKIQLGRCNGTRQKKRVFLHRIVYAAFHGPIPDGLTVNHVDGDKANNSVANLELATIPEQHAHARSLGLVRHRKNGAPCVTHLTADDVREIRRLRALGRTTIALAVQFDTTPSNIRFIATRRTWRHVA